MVSEFMTCRLRQINYDTFHRLINLNHISIFQIYVKHEYGTYFKVKLSMSSFQSIEMHIELHNSIYNDIYDLKFIQIINNDNILLSFVDDNTKCCYVYLIKSKDEILEKCVFYNNELEN